MRHFTLHEALIYGHGDERPFLCPVHGDSRPSASLNMIKKVWYCYTCGARGGLTGEDALVEPDYEVMRQWFTKKLEENRVYSESWLARYTAAGVHPYWAERVGESAARHFRLGFDAESERVTYPLRGWDGSVLGVVRRSLGGDQADAGPKYLYPAGVDVGRLLFNYSIEQRRTVYLVEGALDAIALWRIGVCAFAIYGARLGAEQIRLIERVDPEWIVTAYDNDTAGWRAHYDTERAFPHRRVVRLTWPRSLGKDVDDMGEENLKKCVSSLVLDDLSCVGSTSWSTSPSSTSRTSKLPKNVRNSSGSTSPRRSLRIRLSHT